MGFKEFYKLQKDEQDLFENSFEKYYNKGYFGDVEKEELKEQQKEWFKKLSHFVENKDLTELCMALANKENRVSREWFTKLTGVDIKYETKEKAVEMIHEFVEGSKAINSKKEDSE